MEQLQFRTLTADEIECRVAQAGKNQQGGWCSLLLYKDARCDQRLLDETVGCFRWKREHELINGNLFCTVSIKDGSGEWVSKQDVGTESSTEKEKGQASDAFKRACFNWGLGRELYTSPKIFVNLTSDEVFEQNGKAKVNPRVTFKVSSISYDDKRNISALVITDSKGAVRYTFGNVKAKVTPVAKPELSLEDAKKQISEATTNEQLAAIFKANKHLQNDASFIDALSNRKNQILNDNGAAAA